MFLATFLFLYAAILRSVLSSTRSFEAPFGCPSQGMLLSDQNRTETLSLINGLRESVALGTFQAQNYLSSSSNMDKMAWDCELEQLAQVAVMGCTTNVPQAPMDNARNYHLFGQGSSEFDRTFSIQSALLKWSEVSSVAWPNNNVYNGDQALRELANLIRANTTAVGCSGAKCGATSAAACLFSQPDIKAGDVVFMSGAPCQKDDDCKRFNPGYCENGLCVNATRPSTTTSTTSTTTTSTTTTTTTTRRRSTDCPSAEFSPTFRTVVLGMHNNFRSRVATGNERNGEYANENAPPASRMDLMEYDCTAEQLALNHVRLCDAQPSPDFVRPGYSENIHVLRTTATDLLGALQNAIAAFSHELRGHGIPSNMILAPHVFNRRHRSVTRASKVLWGSNRFVGCATQLCNGFYFTSCMYQNPVNVVGASIYTIGAVCSGCPTGISNCDPAVGLCSY